MKKYGAYGLVEVKGESNAVIVTAAVDEVKNNAPCKVIQTAVISNPSQEMVDIVEMFKNR